jgi:hypothetical protein
MFEQWTMPPFKVTLRLLATHGGGEIYELITGSDRFGHEVDGGFMQLIQGKEEALKRFEAEKQRIMVRVAKIAMRHE